MPMNTKVTPGLRRTPNNVCPVAGTLSAGVWRGPTKKHSKAVCGQTRWKGLRKRPAVFAIAWRG
jgi:hypothetical protein